MLDFADMFSLLGTCTLLYAQVNFKHSLSVQLLSVQVLTWCIK